MIAEIYMGSTSCRITEVERYELSIDGVFCKITDKEGFVFETSPKNVLLISPPQEIEKADHSC